MIGLAVMVVLNGSVIAGTPPAALVAGHVMVPVHSVVTAFADGVSFGPAGSITIVAGTHRCLLQVGSREMRCDDVPRSIAAAPFERDGATYVPVADLARAVGGTVAFDGKTKTAALRFPLRTAVQTPVPFDPRVPQVAPTQLFTPEPARRTPTPRPVETGSPRPRRTAIPATPSRFPGG